MTSHGEPTWRPSTRKAEEQLERVQKRAARWINARWLVQEKRWDTTYLDSLSSLQWLFLSNCRLLGTNCLTYKILHRYYPVLSPHIQPSTHHSHRLLGQTSRINSFRLFLFINARFLWNDLPIGITSSASFITFKHALSTHLYARQSNQQFFILCLHYIAMHHFVVFVSSFFMKQHDLLTAC